MVVINTSKTIYFDAETPILEGLIIAGGKLIFEDSQNVHLRTNYVFINDNGTLQIGTEEKPFTHKAIISILNKKQILDPSTHDLNMFALLNGALILTNGTLKMHGNSVGVTWTYLFQTAYSGESQITLKESVDWSIDSDIIIASTGDYLSQNQSELRRIIEKRENVLILDRPLNFTHLSVKRKVNDIEVEIKTEVGLLSRNIIFQGLFLIV